MRTLLLVAGILFSVVLNAETLYQKSHRGDFFVYVPEQIPENILVVAHGMLSKNDDAADVAKTYLSRWIPYADEHKLLIIVPVFDTPRFGNLGGGYGGYRNLFGKYVAADKFVNNLVDRFSQSTSAKSKQFYLYGHSAGGQFVNRYVVTHPSRIIRAVISAAGRYSYPSKSVQWPYGAGDLNKSIKWQDGSTTQEAVAKTLSNYASAASKMSVVVGADDIKQQPNRPAHVGNNRIEFARSWAEEMNKNARRHGLSGDIKVHVIPAVAHDSTKLTPYCAKILFAQGSI